MAAVRIEPIRIDLGVPAMPARPVAPAPRASNQEILEANLQRRITYFNTHVASSVKWMDVACKVITFISILFLIASAVTPFFGLNPKWLPWTGLAFVVVFEIFVKGKLEGEMRRKTSAKEATVLSQDMLEWPEGAKPVCADKLPSDPRLKSHLKDPSKEQMSREQQAKLQFSIITNPKGIIDRGGAFDDLVSSLGIELPRSIEDAYQAAEARGAPLSDRGVTVNGVKKKWVMLSGDVAICNGKLERAYQADNDEAIIEFQNFRHGFSEVREAAYTMPSPFTENFGKTLVPHDRSSYRLLLREQADTYFRLRSVEREYLRLYEPVFQGNRRSTQFEQYWSITGIKEETPARAKEERSPSKGGMHKLLYMMGAFFLKEQSLPLSSCRLALSAALAALRDGVKPNLVDSDPRVIEAFLVDSDPRVIEAFKNLGDVLERIFQGKINGIEKDLKPREENPSFAPLCTFMAQQEKLIDHYEELLLLHPTNLLKAIAHKLIQIGRVQAREIPEDNQRVIRDLFRVARFDPSRVTSADLTRRDDLDVHDILDRMAALIQLNPDDAILVQQIMAGTRQSNPNDPILVQYSVVLRKYVRLLNLPDKERLNDDDYNKLVWDLRELNNKEIVPLHHRVLGLTPEGKMRVEAAPQMSRLEHCSRMCSILGEVICSSSVRAPYKSLEHLPFEARHLALNNRNDLQAADNKYNRLYYIHHFALGFLLFTVLGFVQWGYFHNQWVVFSVNAVFLALIPIRRWTGGKLEGVEKEINRFRMKEKVLEGPLMIGQVRDDTYVNYRNEGRLTRNQFNREVIVEELLERIDNDLPIPDIYLKKELPPRATRGELRA